MRSSIRNVILFVGIAGSAAGLALWTVFALASDAREEVVRALEREAEAQLALQAETLEGVLEKYRHLPAMLAHRGDVRALFSPAPPEWSSGSGTAIAQDIAGLSGAADVGFLDADGHPLALADDVISRSGGRTADLVAAPLQGRLGRTLLRIDGEPFYAFSFPVRSNERIDGAVVVVADLEDVAETWSLALHPIRAVGPTGAWIVGNDLATSRSAETIERSRFLPQTQWRLFVNRSEAPADLAWRQSVTRSLLVLLIAVGVAAGALWRWRVAGQALRQERAQALRLERRVRDRTSDLANANERLREAQDELVRSAKLAALGRMSASLAHEYNQPLAAVRTYSDNAARLIERGCPEEAREALERITAMAVRMGALSQTLRSFARTPGAELSAVPLDRAIAEARLLLETQAEERGITVGWPTLDAPTLVRGGAVRLSQVIVNLLSNAIEAARNEIHVSVDLHEDAVRLRVADDGPGVAAEIRDQIFDPFFTTREVGQGLGLGLSIAYNIARDFGGSLVLLDTRDGATFELSLPKARVDAPSFSSAEVLPA